MDKNIIGTINFIGYKMRNINYLQNDSFVQHESIEVTFDVDVEVAIDKDNRIARVSLEARIFEDAEKNNYPFSINATIEGFFKLEDGLTDEDIIKLCKINGTAALFPYLRSAISDITRIANETPIILPLINIYKLIKIKEEGNK